MIAYTTLGTNNLEAAGKFYDQLFSLLGAGRAMENERLIAWATGPGTPMFIIIKPFDEKPASSGNGPMISLAAGSKENVDALYKKALELGAKDEGEPGPRGGGAFYLAYWRDLDGNKVAAFHPA